MVKQPADLKNNIAQPFNTLVLNCLDRYINNGMLRAPGVLGDRPSDRR